MYVWGCACVYMRTRVHGVDVCVSVDLYVCGGMCRGVCTYVGVHEYEVCVHVWRVWVCL